MNVLDSDLDCLLFEFRAARDTSRHLLWQGYTDPTENSTIKDVAGGRLTFSGIFYPRMH